MTGSALVGLIILLVVGYWLIKWHRWSNRYLKANKVSGNPGRKRKVYEQDRPFAECFDDNDTAWKAEMEDDL